jgi:lipopolysaccharide cholinephosphotransferase
MLSLDEIKEIQLSILNEVHDFCTQKGISYSLAHGTLLGAVRHKGYIPWDDDIDICLLEKDYEVFMKSFSHPYLRVLCLEVDPECPYPYGKVYDTRTVLNEDANVSYPIGVNIDVFPIYHYPEDRFRSAALNARLFLLSWIHNVKVIKLSRQRNILKNALLLILKLLCIPFPFHLVTSRIRRVCLAADKRISLRVFETRASQTVIYDAKSFDEYELMEFEGNSYKVIRGWHDYLLSRHGNYMVLPPKEKQVSHHNINADWKNED